MRSATQWCFSTREWHHFKSGLIVSSVPQMHTIPATSFASPSPRRENGEMKRKKQNFKIKTKSFHAERGCISRRGGWCSTFNWCKPLLYLHRCYRCRHYWIGTSDIPTATSCQPTEKCIYRTRRYFEESLHRPLTRQSHARARLLATIVDQWRDT